MHMYVYTWGYIRVVEGLGFRTPKSKGQMEVPLGILPGGGACVTFGCKGGGGGIVPKGELGL